MAGKTSGRIVATRNAEDIVALAKAIYKKHQADDKDSILHLLEDVKWSDVGPTIEAAAEQAKLAADLKRQMEEAFAKRDEMLAPIIAANNASKKLLKGKYASNPKKLGEWGFDVDNTPAKPRAQKNP